MKRRSSCGLVLIALLLSGCVQQESPNNETISVTPASMVGGFAPMEVPSAPGAGQPYIAVDSSGAFLMSWTEPVGDMSAVKVARYQAGTWQTPTTVVERDDLFVNWADFPSVASSGNALYVHWLQRSAPGTYNYDVVATVSGDGGTTWKAPFVVHDDGVKAEHGFASFLPLPDDKAAITWLDGRGMAEGHDGDHGDMSLRYAVISPDGSISERALLDDRTCECCTTTITSTPTGPLVAWRDRAADEVRDIDYSRLEGGAWTPPAPVHVDGWNINGCPVNGPQADSSGEVVVLAWFTGADELGRVKAAFSTDGGVSFGSPIELASGASTMGYLDSLLISESRAFVVWMEDREDRLELVGREVALSGELAETVSIASTTRGRTGFPRMAKSGDEILLAWNERGDSPGVRAARATISKSMRNE